MPAVLDLADLIEARAPGPGYTCHRGNVPDKPPGAYAVFYFGGGSTQVARLGGSPSDFRWTFRVVCAGFSERQAINTVDLIRARLTGWRPEGLNGPVLVELEDDPALLPSTGVPGDTRYSMTLTYRLYTTRS